MDPVMSEKVANDAAAFMRSYVSRRGRNAELAETAVHKSVAWSDQEALDKKLMTTVVPWVPYLWANNVDIVGPKVTHWNYDQFTDGPAYSSVSMK